MSPTDKSDERKLWQASTLLSHVLTRVYSARAQHLEGSEIAGLPTGFDLFDRGCGGLHEGLHIVAAETGVGKTTLAQTIARNAAQQGYPTLYVTFDEGSDRLALQQLCTLAGLNYRDVNDGLVEPDRLEQAFSANRSTLERLYYLRAVPLFDAEQATTQLAACIKRFDARNGLMIIDYLQGIAASRRAGGGDYRVSIAELLVELRRTAMYHHLPVLLTSSMPPQSAGRMALPLLREPDVESTADTITLLSRDDRAVSGDGEKALRLDLLKNRYGPPGLMQRLVLDAANGLVRADGEPT